MFLVTVFVGLPSVLISHAMICQHGGLTFVCHNEPHDLTVAWLQEVCHNVTIEPPLHPLIGKSISPTTAIHGDAGCSGRYSCKRLGFWGRQQSAFFKLGIFILTHQAIVVPRLHLHFKDMNLIWKSYSCCCRKAMLPFLQLSN